MKKKKREMNPIDDSDIGTFFHVLCNFAYLDSPATMKMKSQEEQENM